MYTWFTMLDKMMFLLFLVIIFVINDSGTIAKAT